MESSELQKTIKAVLEQIKRHELDFFVYSGATQYGSSIPVRRSGMSENDHV